MADGAATDSNAYPVLTTALWVGVLNNDAELEEADTHGEKSFRIIWMDPTEGAILVAAAKAGLVHAELDAAYPRQQEIPFDLARKRMVTIHKIHAPQPQDPSPFYDAKENRGMWWW